MKWKKRRAEIERLRKKHPVVRPDVVSADSSSRQPPSYPSLTSTGVSRIVFNARQQHLTSSSVIVGTPHKQGPMVMFHDELPWAGGKKS